MRNREWMKTPLRPPPWRPSWEWTRGLLLWAAIGAGVLLLVALWVGPDLVRDLDRTRLEMKNLEQLPAAHEWETEEFERYHELATRAAAIQGQLRQEQVVFLHVREHFWAAGLIAGAVCLLFALGYAFTRGNLVRTDSHAVEGYVIFSFFLGFPFGATMWALARWADFLIYLPLYGAVLGLACRATIPILSRLLGWNPGWME